MARRLLTVAFFFLVFFASNISMNAQVAPAPQFGVVPTGSYESYHVDAMNMQNGNSIIKIPLFSLPQLGKLSLSFSAISNTTYWQPEYVCNSDGYDCQYDYIAIPPTYSGASTSYSTGGEVGFGPSIVSDNAPFAGWKSYATPTICTHTPDTSLMSPCYSTLWSVADSTGGSHSLYYNSADVSQLRTTDGSGFLYLSGLPDPSKAGMIAAGTPTADPVLIDSRGVKNTYSLSSGIGRQIDPDSNVIEWGIDHDTDSVGRVIPHIPDATSSIVGCPNLNQLYQPAVSSASWTVPGPNNSQSTYLICYANISYHTNFFGNGGHSIFSTFQDSNSDEHMISWLESQGSVPVIQSIVLPDKTYWAFIYDAADPSDNESIAYGTISKLITPEGGSIAYSYWEEPIGTCSAGGYSPMYVNGRTVSDGNGHDYAWHYSIGPLSGHNDSVSTDPNQNDTVYHYEGAPWVSGAICSPLLEKSRKQYQGSATAGTLLRTVATSYIATPGPVPAGSYYTEYGNALAQTVTTTVDTGASTVTSNTYGGSFTANMPSWGVYYNYATSTWVYAPVQANVQPSPITLSLSIPTATSTTDYSSSVLSSSSTEYLWQSNANYFAANLLDTPTVITRFDGTNPAAQTTISYDESSYSPSGFRGHPTTTNTWLNTNPGLSPTSHTGWSSKGMKTYTIDPDMHLNSNGHTTDTVFGAQYGGLFPTSSINALNQTTAYTWDLNSGHVALVTDPNGVLTNYIYADPKGRLSEIRSAAGTPIESRTTYSYPTISSPTYPSPTTWQISATQDQNTTHDGNIGWSARVDGLGRTVLKINPNGSKVVTTYDGLDQVVSISNPYFSESDPTYGLTSYMYDALGRTTLQTNPDTTTLQWSYSGPSTTSIDEAGNQWQRVTDALGRLTSVIEPNGAKTTYSYNALDDLIGVSQLGLSGETSRTRSFNYNSLSRLLWSQNPETGVICYGQGNGTVAGCQANGYDANGNLLVKTDSRSIAVNYSYDALNRLTGKYASDGSVWDSYHYDQTIMGPNEVGRLGYSEHDGMAGTGFYYDAMGRTVGTSYYTPISGGWQGGMGASYDLAGNMISLTYYPDGRIVDQVFDGAGRLAKVSNRATATTPAFDFIYGSNTLPNPGDTPTGGIQYTAAGAAQSYVLGNGVGQHNEYNTRLQPTHTMVSTPVLPGSVSALLAGTGPGNLLDRQAFYTNFAPAPCGPQTHNNGNIYAITDNLQVGNTQSFCYDPLNRLLTAARSDGAYNHTYNYDSFGNMVLHDNLAAPSSVAWTIDQSTNRLLRSHNGGVTWGDNVYDAAGNLQSVSDGISPTVTYQYNALNQLSSVNNAQTAVYVYNGMDERVYKSMPASWTEYIYLNGQPMAEHTSNGTWTDYIYANGQKIAKVDSADTRVHLTAVNAPGSGDWGLTNLPVPANATIQAGDVLSFRMYEHNATATTSLGFTDGSNSDWYCGICYAPIGGASDQWVNASIAVGGSVASPGPMVNKTFSYFFVGQRGGSSGEYDVMIADIALVHPDGSVVPFPVPLGNVGFGGFLTSTTGASGMSEVVSTTSTAIGAVADTHYYLDDHLGTTQMELSAGGWPVWEGQFTPFGQEIVNAAPLLPGQADGSSMHYKFTGKERDAESGLDYFGARYYASSVGRWMSPDPLMASAKAANPQTWNRYNYVLNNPLGLIDPDGLDVSQACIKDKKCTIHVKVNVIYDSSVKFTQKDKDKFQAEQLDKAKKDFGRSNISLDFTYTKGGKYFEIDGKPFVLGLDKDSLNVVVSNTTPGHKAGDSEKDNGYSVAYIAAGLGSSWNWILDSNNTEHEMAHHFAGDLAHGPLMNFIYDIRNNFGNTAQGLGSRIPLYREGLEHQRYATETDQRNNVPKQ